MRKIGIFAFFNFFLNFCVRSFVVENEGAGDYDEYLDTELEESQAQEETKEEPTKKEKPEKKPPDEKKKEPPVQVEVLTQEQKEALKKAEEYAKRTEQKEDLEELEAKFKKSYGERFDMKKIIAHLQDMEKKEPGSGDAIFNPIGIENIYLKHFAKSDNEFDSGRETRGLSTDELIGKINSGEATDEQRTKFFAKYA